MYETIRDHINNVQFLATRALSIRKLRLYRLMKRLKADGQIVNPLIQTRLGFTLAQNVVDRQVEAIAKAPD